MMDGPRHAAGPVCIFRKESVMANQTRRPVPPRRVGNPTVAAIVSLVMVGLGAYLYLGAQPSSTVKAFAVMFVIIGIFGFFVNVYLRQRFKREDSGHHRQPKT